MIKRTVEVTDLHMRTDKCEDCVDVYIASEVYARISELASLLRECIADSGAENFLGADVVERIRRVL